MEFTDAAAFTFATWQIRSCLLCKFFSPGASLFGFPRIFFLCALRQEKWIAELFFWNMFQRSEEKLNFWKPSKELVRTDTDCVIDRGITTVLKIAVDNVILELCDSFDFFANPLLKKGQLNLIVTFRKESVVNSFRIFMPIHIPKKVTG